MKKVIFILIINLTLIISCSTQEDASSETFDSTDGTTTGTLTEWK